MYSPWLITSRACLNIAFWQGVRGTHPLMFSLLYMKFGRNAKPFSGLSELGFYGVRKDRRSEKKEETMEINKKRSISCVWSDNWWVEREEAWFVDGMYNTLFCLDLKTYECKFMVEIPEKSSSKFRLTPRCIKCGFHVFCMPDLSSHIWIYNINYHSFSKIEIENPEKVRLKVHKFWKRDGKIFAVSAGLKQILEIDIEKQKVERIHSFYGKGEISDSLWYEDFIYSLSDTVNEIYQFNMVTKERMIYKLPDIGRKFYAFSFDGDKFWLSGYFKEIYIWKKGGDTIKVLDEFPEGFGIYNFTPNTDGKVDCITIRYETPVFCYSVILGGKVWFIPFQTNQIICVDKMDCKIHVFEIEEEIETLESLLSRKALFYKYIPEYITKERYLGLFSLKNNCVVEIDTWEGKVRKKEYAYGDDCLKDMLRIYKVALQERNIFHRHFFAWRLLREGVGEKDNITDNVGTKVYQSVRHFN